MEPSTFDPINPVAPVLALILALSGLTQEKAREKTGIGEKPFSTLLDPKGDPKQKYVVRLAPLLDLEPWPWLGLLGEAQAEMALRCEYPRLLEALPGVYGRVVSLVRKKYGVAKVDRELARRAVKHGPAPVVLAESDAAQVVPEGLSPSTRAAIQADIEAIQTNLASASEVSGRLKRRLGESPDS